MTTQVVTPAQVLAAKLAVELQEEDGEQPDPALVAISGAEVVDLPRAELDADGSRFTDAVQHRYPGLSESQAAVVSREIQSFVAQAVQANWDLAVVHRDPDGNQVFQVFEVKSSSRQAKPETPPADEDNEAETSSRSSQGIF